MATTQASDIVFGTQFTRAVQEYTAIKSALVQSGAIVRDPLLDAFLNNPNGGDSITIRSWRDIRVAANVSSDDPDAFATPNKTSMGAQKAVRLSRNIPFSSMDITAALAGADPLDSVAQQIGGNWGYEFQSTFVAAMKGVIANNIASDSGDMVWDISNAAGSGNYSAGVTDFHDDAVIDAVSTMGDNMGDLTFMMINSITLNKALKRDMIDTVPASEGKPWLYTYMGRAVIVDDMVPYNAVTKVSDTWFFGAGAFAYGLGLPMNPIERQRSALAGNGGGQDVFVSRQEMIVHPYGYSFVGSPATVGGPTNATSSNNLGNASSWDRVATERKQVKFAVLRTRESAP